MSDLTCDVAIIGAGTAGLAAERAARKAGAKTLLIDDRFAGTTCASVGCMPSKLLIAAARAAFDARKASTFGIETKTSVDGRAVMARVREERDRFVAETLKSIERIPDGICIRQRARFSDATALALDDGRKVSAKAIVIATGSRPNVPKPFEKLGDIVLTNETIFELESLPRSVAVVGAGPLGLELAQAMARLGVETTMFDQGEHIAALRDGEVAKILGSVLGKEFPIHLGVKLDVQNDGHGARLSWSGASSGAAFFERVLVAAGRPPALHDLNMAATGLETNEHGIPKFDPGWGSMFLSDVGARLTIFRFQRFGRGDGRWPSRVHHGRIVGQWRSNPVRAFRRRSEPRQSRPAKVHACKFQVQIWKPRPIISPAAADHDDVASYLRYRGTTL
jgi:dihydrolipoamide dehydrogenase